MVWWCEWGEGCGEKGVVVVMGRRVGVKRKGEGVLLLTFDIVSAGLHWCLRMSRQMPPLALMLGLRK